MTFQIGFLLKGAEKKFVVAGEDRAVGVGGAKVGLGGPDLRRRRSGLGRRPSRGDVAIGADDPIKFFHPGVGARRKNLRPSGRVIDGNFLNARNALESALNEDFAISAVDTVDLETEFGETEIHFSSLMGIADKDFRGVGSLGGRYGAQRRAHRVVQLFSG